MINLATIRAYFPGTNERVFLDAASVGLMPTQAEDALKQLAHDLVHVPSPNTGAHHRAIAQSAGAARREIARLINARSADVALVESTTHGLELLAAAIPLQHGDKILVGATEYLGLAVPWLPKRETDGLIVEVIPARDGRLLVEDYAAAINARTRLILLSSVQWNNGFRCDLAAFSELARSRKVLLLVDTIQQLGAITLDVQRTPVDFVVNGGHKWLNAPAGRGFLYVNPGVVDRLRPPPRGYLNIETPAEGWGEYFATPTIPSVRDYAFVKGARAFEVGGFSNNPGNVVLAATVALLNEVGPGVIEAHVVGLTDLLMEQLHQAGATVVTPAERASRSGIVTFTLGEGAARDRDLLSRLWEQRIILSQRYTAGVGGLRASVHLFNNEDDVNRLAEAVAAR